MWLSLPLDGLLSAGTYRAKFRSLIPISWLPNVSVPKETTVGNWRFTLTEYQKNVETEQLTLTLKLEEIPSGASAPSGRATILGSPALSGPQVDQSVTVVPIIAIGGVVAGLLGIAGLVLSLQSLERLVDKGSINFLIVAVSLIGLVIVYKFVLKN